MKFLYFVFCGIAAVSSPAVLFSSASQAQTLAPLPAAPKGCVYLKEIATGQPQIRKVVRLGSENTDFAVPTGIQFSSYTIQLIPENNANYNAELYFKYNDSSNAKVFGKTIAAQRFKLEAAPFRTPSVKQPYQVNFKITSARNNAYQIAVFACR